MKGLVALIVFTYCTPTFCGRESKCSFSQKKEGDEINEVEDCEANLMHLKPMEDHMYQKSAPLIVHLDSMEDHWIDKNKLILIESSGRNFLPSRYLCAAESAAKFAGVPVIVLMTSPTLNASHSNASRHLYHPDSTVLHFRYADPLDTLRQSPFGENAENVLRRISASEKKVVQLSDALRLAVIYRFGGWYADFDTVFMKNLTHFETDVISTDNYYPESFDKKQDQYGHRVLGTMVANGMFRFAKSKSDFLFRTIRLFVRDFRNTIRSSGGAIIMTKVLKATCVADEGDRERNLLTVERFSAEKCRGLQLVDTRLFYPFSWLEASGLFLPGKSKVEWEEATKDSYSMDFFQSSMTGEELVLWPKYYGQKLPAYAVLAPKFCPSTFFSHRYF